MSATAVFGAIVGRHLREMFRTEPRRSLPEGVWVKTGDTWTVWAKGARRGWRHVRVRRADGTSTVERVTSTQERATGCLFYVASGGHK